MKNKYYFAALLITLSVLAFATTPVFADECQFQTNYGTMTLHWERSTGQVTGYYPHKSGRISGYRDQKGVVRGDWWQSDSAGQFVFWMNNSGFTGKWKYNSDQRWNGDWNGSLLGCF
jgi:hypothetical protein